MEQCDVCAVCTGGRRVPVRYVVILQYQVSSDLATCVVAPLVPVPQLPLVERLRPAVLLDGRRYVLAIDRLAAVERRTIGPAVGTVKHQRDQIIAALDLLFTGF